MTKKVKKTTKQAADTETVKKKPSGKSVPTEARKTSAKKNVRRANKTMNKTVVRKSSDSNPIKRKTHIRRKTTLSKAELAHFHDLLLEKLKEIQGDVDQIETEALKKSRLDASGDLSSMPIHMADIGSDNYEQEFSLGLMDGERKIVHEIHEALKRIEDGTYGICEGMGEPIPKSRLEGIPWARYCVEYAERIEKGLADEDERWSDQQEEGDREDDDALDDEEGLDEEESPGDNEDEKEESPFLGFDEENDTELA